MSEPKRYEFTESEAYEVENGRWIRADDPALLEWKRDSDALRKLEREIPRDLPNNFLAKSVDGLTVFLQIGLRLFTGLSLREAIEAIKEGE